ncbi:MAG: thioredoxin domain-containing protein [Thermostichales cyanobacterium BF4_bins_65]
MQVRYLATLAVLFLITGTMTSPRVLASCAGMIPLPKKPTSVGGPLAASLQGKPVLVDLVASWCSACQKRAPTMAALKQAYADKVHFVSFDLSNAATVAAAQAEAQKLGLGDFLAAHRSQAGLVLIVDPKDGTILASFSSPQALPDYSQALEAALQGSR